MRRLLRSSSVALPSGEGQVIGGRQRLVDVRLGQHPPLAHQLVVQGRKRAGSCCHRGQAVLGRLGGALPLNGSSDHQPQIVGMGLEQPGHLGIELLQ